MERRLAKAAIALMFLGLLPPASGATETPLACSDKYHTEGKFLANPDESILIAGVIGWCRKNQTRLIWDERYAIVARFWSGYLVKSGPPSQRALPVDRLRFELKLQGVTDGRVEPYSAEGPTEKMPPGLLQFLEQGLRTGSYTHFAVGVTRTSDQQRMVSTLLLGSRPALIDPLPVCPSPGGRMALHLRLLRNFRHPRWLLTTPQGSVVRDVLLYQEGAWHGTVPFDAGRGIYQMEIVVLGPAGPEVAALFPLYVGVERPSIPTVKLHSAPGRYRTPEDAEEALVRLINQIRSQQGLPPLTPDEKLSAVAREHSLQLLANRRAVHRTDTTGTLLDRLSRSGIPFTRALENVSLSSSPEMAHERFMESPGHRLNVLDPNATHLGVGIALQRDQQEDVLAVTEVFVEPPESEDASSLASRVAKLINQARKSRGRFLLGLDAELSQEALRSARRLAASADRADPEREGAEVVENFDQDQPGFTKIRVRYFKTANLQLVLASPELLDQDLNRLGIGVAKTTSPSLPGELWIAVIFAGR